MGVIKKLGKLLTLFVAGALLYMGIELGFRGYTFWLMGVCGGLAFISIGAINEFIEWDMPIWVQSLIAGLMIVSYELLFGILFNQQHQMWDYSNVPFNYKGQICLPFFFIWCGLGIVGIVLDDFIRHWLFKEECPHYVWI